MKLSQIIKYDELIEVYLNETNDIGLQIFL
jgi:hypothetical protein